eukprot:Skav203565  [mRNA]  locus=scaffold3576:182541:194610:+ [translate_table: standard]
MGRHADHGSPWGLTALGGSSSIDWSYSDEGMPALHYACLNEATEPTKLLGEAMAVAPVAKDSDDDTALDAILALTDEDPDEESMQAHLAGVRALLHCNEQPLGKRELQGRPPADAPPLRFLEGDRVICRVEAPGNQTTWEEGVVVGVWYREAWHSRDVNDDPALNSVKLDIGSHVYSLADHPGIVQKEARETLRAAAAAGYAAAAKPMARFQKRQREDGSNLA